MKEKRGAADMKEEMEVFDQLPAKIRTALNYGPKKYLNIAALRWWTTNAADIDTAAKLIRTGQMLARKVEKEDCN